MRRAEAEPIFRIKIPRVGERAVRTRNEQGWPCTGPYTGRPNKVQYFCFVAANGNILEAEAWGAPALLPPVSSVSLANFCPDLRYTRKILQRILQRPPSSYASMQKIAKMTLSKCFFPPRLALQETSSFRSFELQVRKKIYN